MLSGMSVPRLLSKVNAASVAHVGIRMSRQFHITNTRGNQKMDEVEQILDFVNDHYERFGAYPMEVETDNAVYTFDQYWSILDAA